MNSEQQLVEFVRRALPCGGAGILVGPGDDAAVLQIHENIVVTSDMLLDGVHFRVEEIAARLIGRKAAAVNLSDLAAMAADPVALVVGLALPRGCGIAMAEEILIGISDLASEFGAAVVGGDTNSWKHPLAISVTAIGKASAPILRSGARVGDKIFVSGALGGSLEHGRHLRFWPRVDEAKMLRRHFTLHSLMDISDGLALDLTRLVRESGVGAVVEAARIPVHGDLAPLAGSPAVHRALTDGEDFELLFTVPAPEAPRVATECAFAHEIGTIVANSHHVTLLWPNGESETVATGFQHEF